MDLNRYFSILKSLPEEVRLVAVSKTKSVEEINLLYSHGQRIFGENKAQELKEKYEFLPKDIEWHFIGHLQTNKVKYIAPFVSMIHAVDSLSLLAEIDKQAAKHHRTIPCLLQFHIAQEDTKFGLDLEECDDLLRNPQFGVFKNVEIHGVMGMATFTNNSTQIKQEFKTLATIFNHLKSNYFKDKNYFMEISMGMTDDYLLAIEEGSTLVRIGSAIFGTR